MDHRDDEGKFGQEYADEEFVAAVENLDVASTQRVADRVGCSYNLAYQRLNELAECGAIEREEVGPSFVWTPE